MLDAAWTVHSRIRDAQDGIGQTLQAWRRSGNASPTRTSSINAMFNTSTPHPIRELVEQAQYKCCQPWGSVTVAVTRSICEV